MNRGDRLSLGEFLTSPNEKYILLMSFDGRLKLSYTNLNRVFWQINTSESADRFFLDSNGNLVLQARNSNLWQSNTRNQGEYLVLENNANLVLYDANDTQVWSSGSAIGELNEIQVFFF